MPKRTTWCMFLFLILFLISCSPGTTTPITMTITHIMPDTKTFWGCPGQDTRTYLRSEEGKMAFICGTWGKPGDKISGYWTEGHWDGDRNGFRLSR